MSNIQEELKKRSEALSRTLSLSWWIGVATCAFSFGMEFHSAWIALGLLGGAFALQAISAQIVMLLGEI